MVCIHLTEQMRLVPSTSGGHSHLYLPPVPRWKMWLLLTVLRMAFILEMGNFWWSLRRGGTFVRLPGIQKQESEQVRYSYGMFFKLKEKR